MLKFFARIFRAASSVHRGGTSLEPQMGIGSLDLHDLRFRLRAYLAVFEEARATAAAAAVATQAKVSPASSKRSSENGEKEKKKSDLPTSSSSSSSSSFNLLPQLPKYFSRNNLKKGVAATSSSSSPPASPPTTAKVKKWKSYTCQESKEADELTRSFTHALVSNPGDWTVIPRLEKFCSHCHSHPTSLSTAIKEDAVGLLLNIRRVNRNPSAQILVREALNIVGYHDPPKGAQGGIRILSIDGGGMRGVIGLEILRAIESISGRRIHELFDFICGVSTGAIIISFLGFHQKSIQEVEETYRTIGLKVFSQSILNGAKGYLMSHSYYDTKLYEQILKDYVGENETWETSRNPLTPKVAIVSTLVSDTRIAPFVFRNYGFPHRIISNYKGTCRKPIWAAVRASSAAPGYFDEFLLNDRIHHDGGMMTNNAAQIAIHEAQKVWPNSKIQCLVSLGLGRFDPLTFEKNPKSPKSLSLAQKFSRIVDSATDTELVHETLNDLLPGQVYFRFNPYLSEYLDLDETRPEKMSLMKDAAKMYIRRNHNKIIDACLQLEPSTRNPYVMIQTALRDNYEILKAKHYHSVLW